MDLGTRIKVVLNRFRTISFRRMTDNIRMIHKEHGVNSVFIACDMVWSFLRYGVGYLDYHVFGFAKNRGAKRKTFMTMNHNIGLARMVNDTAFYPILNDKMQFLELFGDFIGRAWLDLRKTDVNTLAAFCKAHPTIFVKPIDNFGGTGIEKVTCDADTDFAALHAHLLENGQVLVEEAICQHSDMSRLCASSVNTLRIVTLVIHGEAKFVYSLIRMGSGKGHVDNISSGGMYTKVEDGKLPYPAFCDKTGCYYETHPVSGVRFREFTVPYFKEAVELCCKAAMVEPRLGYIGWDVAITPNGPILVEGNNLPGYDMVQNWAFHPDGCGILPEMEKLVGQPVRKV